MAYGRQKDLTKRTESDKVLRDKVSEIASNPQYDGYQKGLVYKCFDEKSSESSVSPSTRQRNYKKYRTKIRFKPNRQLAHELHRPIIRKSQKM